MASKIMIVDDNPDLVIALAVRLRAAGYEVVHALDGVTALPVAIKEKPDLIVLDIGLPGADGHTVASRLRSNEAVRHIPVVFLTARSEIRHRVLAAERQCAGYLLKPVRADTLLEVVCSVLQSTALGR